MPWLARQNAGYQGLPPVRRYARRRGTIRLVWIHGLDCASRTNPQRHMEYRWADPVAALVLTPLILREGWETAKGKPCSRS